MASVSVRPCRFAAGTVTTVGVPMKAGSIPVGGGCRGRCGGGSRRADDWRADGEGASSRCRCPKGRHWLASPAIASVLSPGPHDLRLVSETLGFEKPLHAEIFAGKTTICRCRCPSGTLSLNATPWAEVWIDGQKVGETPIGNLSLPVGPHEIVFKNPDLGEQHHAATVTATAPVRPQWT